MHHSQTQSRFTTDESSVNAYVRVNLEHTLTLFHIAWTGALAHHCGELSPSSASHTLHAAFVLSL